MPAAKPRHQRRRPHHRRGDERLSPQHFLWDVAGKVATITLNRPARKNPLTFDSYAELRDTFRALNDMADVKAVVITGAGGNFCSGGDVHEIIGPLTQMDAHGLRKFTRMTGDLVRAMRACPQPIIAAVDGVCAGAGAIMAMASDLRLSSPTSKTAFLFSRVGLSGADMGACAMLPRIIGHGRAAELLFTGRAMSAEEGHAWGFYNRLTDNVLADAQVLAGDLANGPSFAHSMTKRQLDAEWHVSIETALDLEAEAQAVCMETNDFRRAYEAIAAKRSPEFEGD
ncbi:MAG: enoyl-CoA hydratase family protein [Sphingomonas sp.]|nr:enoyl-CoA hydratase family protein [Sphingomonas sp.]